MTGRVPHTSGIAVIGLGPGDPELRTVGAQRRLDAAARIVLRTARHPGLDDLAGDGRVIACDDLYESEATFDAVYEAISRRVCGFAVETSGPVVYAVPGHPRFGERSVTLLLAEAGRRQVPVTVEAAVSAFDAVATALGIDLMADQVQVVDAASLIEVHEREPFAGGMAALDPSRPVLVCQVYARQVATAVKLTLGRLYPDEQPIVIVRSAGVPGDEACEPCRLFELDRRDVDHLTSVWVPAVGALEASRSPFTLQRIVARLRAPDGCPWDRQQTHRSLRDAIIEEAYETVDAIDAGDSSNLAEELGDLLLIVAMHAQIADEAGDFAIEDVYDQVSRKLVRRHPHVFGGVAATTPDEVVATWNAVKAAERAAAGMGKASVQSSPLDTLPRSMPALQRSRVLFGARKGDRAGETDLEAIAGVGDALLFIARKAAEAGVDAERALHLALRRQVEMSMTDDEAAPKQRSESA